MNKDKVQALIELNEGRRNTMYYDSVGIPTIGVGHNLRDKPLSDRVVDLIFEEDYEEHLDELYRVCPWLDDHDEVRKAALLDLCFNLGPTKLAMFKQTLTYFKIKAYDLAADALTQSKWYTQVGVRGPRIVEMVRTGHWPKEIA